MDLEYTRCYFCGTVIPSCYSHNADDYLHDFLFDCEDKGYNVDCCEKCNKIVLVNRMFSRLLNEPNEGHLLLLVRGLKDIASEIAADGENLVDYYERAKSDRGYLSKLSDYQHKMRGYNHRKITYDKEKTS